MFYIKDIFGSGLCVTEKTEEANHAYGQFETKAEADKYCYVIFNNRGKEKAQIERVNRMKRLAKMNALAETKVDLIERIIELENRIQSWIQDAPEGKECKLKASERMQIERWRGEITGMMLGLGIILNKEED